MVSVLASSAVDRGFEHRSGQTKDNWYYTNTLSWIFIVLAYWKNSPRVDISLHSDTLFWFRENQSLLLLLNAAYFTHYGPLQWFPYYNNHIGGVIVIVLSSSMVDRGFEPRSGQTKDYTIGICCFSAKYAALRSKSKDWFSRNQNNVSEWSDMSTRGLFMYIYKPFINDERNTLGTGECSLDSYHHDVITAYCTHTNSIRVQFTTCLNVRVLLQ
jgi:hypothetical protein